MQNTCILFVLIQLAKFGYAQKAKWTQPAVFTSPLLAFFSLAGHLVGFFILVGTVFRKTFRIVGLGGRG